MILLKIHSFELDYHKEMERNDLDCQWVGETSWEITGGLIEHLINMLSAHGRCFRHKCRP